MKTQDIKIGSPVLFNGSEFEVYKVSQRCLFIRDPFDIYDTHALCTAWDSFKNVYGVPITEDRLIRLPVNWVWHKRLQCYSYHYKTETGYAYLRLSIEDKSSKELVLYDTRTQKIIKYMHELQNYVHAITGIWMEYSFHKKKQL